MYSRLSSNTECLLSKTLERMMIEGRSCAQSQPVSQTFAIRRSNLPSCWNQSRHELGLALQYLLREDPAAISLSEQHSNPSLCDRAEVSPISNNAASTAPDLHNMRILLTILPHIFSSFLIDLILSQFCVWRCFLLFRAKFVLQKQTGIYI
jgi:hypothetical protein